MTLEEMVERDRTFNRTKMVEHAAVLKEFVDQACEVFNKGEVPHPSLLVDIQCQTRFLQDRYMRLRTLERLVEEVDQKVRS